MIKFYASSKKNSLNEDVDQPEQREMAIAFWHSTEMESQTRHSTPSTVLDADERRLPSDSFTLMDFSQAQRDDELCRKRFEPVRYPHPVSTTTGAGY